MTLTKTDDVPSLPTNQTLNLFSPSPEKHKVSSVLSEIKLAPLTSKSELRDNGFYPLLSFDLTDDTGALIDLGLYAKPTRSLLNAWAVVSDSVYSGVNFDDFSAPIMGFSSYPLADNTWQLLVKPVYVPGIKSQELCATSFWGEHFSHEILSVLSNHPQVVKIKNTAFIEP